MACTVQRNTYSTVQSALKVPVVAQGLVDKDKFAEDDLSAIIPCSSEVFYYCKNSTLGRKEILPSLSIVTYQSSLQVTGRAGLEEISLFTCGS